MSFVFSGVDHVQLAAPDGSEGQARKFFQGVLGWEEISKPEPLLARGGCWFQCGTHQVHIGIQKNFVPATKAHPAFRVTNLNGLREHLSNHNVEVIDDANRVDEGIQRFFAHDPFGNRLEFLETV